MGSRWVPLLLAPGAMALVRVWVLVLAFNTDLAQKTLEEVPVQLDFDAHKVEGRWFTIQLASSLRDLVLTTDPLRLSLHSIWTRSSGDVDFVLYEKFVKLKQDDLEFKVILSYIMSSRTGWAPGNMDYVCIKQEKPQTNRGEGLCTGFSVTVHPTGLQGQYQGSFDGSRLHVHFVSTDYDTLILYVRVQDNEVVNLWALLARRIFEDPMWLGKYLGFVEKFQLQKSLVFNIADQCPLDKATA